jgi:hypothetical protein
MKLYGLPNRGYVSTRLYHVTTMRLLVCPMFSAGAVAHGYRGKCNIWGEGRRPPSSHVQQAASECGLVRAHLALGSRCGTGRLTRPHPTAVTQLLQGKRSRCSLWALLPTHALSHSFTQYVATVSFQILSSYSSLCCVDVRPPLWSSGQSSWLQIRRPGFYSRHYQIF